MQTNKRNEVNNSKYDSPNNTCKQPTHTALYQVHVHQHIIHRIPHVILQRCNLYSDRTFDFTADLRANNMTWPNDATPAVGCDEGQITCDMTYQRVNSHDQLQTFCQFTWNPGAPSITINYTNFVWLDTRCQVRSQIRCMFEVLLRVICILKIVVVDFECEFQFLR
jgi:hypothetical protein